MNERLIDSFVRYQALSWHLTPCHPKDKAPTLLGKGGWYNASPDASEWMAWARTHKDCLWGVRPVGFCVLDADVKHQGVELLRRLEEEHGTLPRTPTVKTGGGGRHYYFACDASLTSKKIDGCDGLEIITHNKGVVIPPSIHPNGTPYVWELAPWECPMAQLPAWLLNAKPTPVVQEKVKLIGLEVQPKEPSTDESDFVWGGVGFDTLGALPEGERNKPVADAIVQEKCSGVSEEECTNKAMEWASRNGYDEAEMRRKITSIYGNERFVAKDTSFPPPIEPEPRSEEEEGCNPPSLTLKPEAYHGLFGEMLRAVEGEMETSPAGALLGWLTLLGNVVGRGAYFLHKAKRHHPALYLGNVSRSGNGKADTWDVVKYPFAKVEPEWEASRIKGVGSGEGLIEQVDDEASDKRFVARQPELSRAMKQQRRENSTLSEILREAWDGERLSITNRKDNALSAEGYSISVVGDITPSVLRKLLDKGTEGEDGWANRFLWCVIDDLRDLSDGGNIYVLDAFLPRLEDAIAFGKGVGEMKRDGEAKALWDSVYRSLKRSGRAVPHTDRARPYVMRLAMLYAIADKSSSIGKAHLTASLALWDYCVESARELFAPEQSPLALRLLKIIQGKPSGASRTDMRGVIGNKAKASDIDEALASLRERHLAYPKMEDTGGRKAEVWFAGMSDTTPLFSDGTTSGGGREVSPTDDVDFVWGEEERKPDKAKVKIGEIEDERGML